MKLLTSQLTSDEDVGHSPRFYVIKCQLCIQNVWKLHVWSRKI